MSRVIALNKGYTDTTGSCVLYVMSRDQRTRDNHALLRAQEIAEEQNLPLVVLFVLLRNTGNRSREHFSFMLEGLKQVKQKLNKKNITFVLRAGNPQKKIQSFIDDESPAAIIFDFNPLKGPRALAKKIAASNDVKCEVVDTHNVIPLWVTSDKKEYAAHTIRAKIHKNLQDYMVEPQELRSMKVAMNASPDDITFEEAQELIESVPESGVQICCKPGEDAASSQLEYFINQKLEAYAIDRNNPVKDGLSELSPYLHYGHISSLRVALEVVADTAERPLLYDEGKLAQSGDEPSKKDGMNALLEEMIVRKELSDNFCFYISSYTSLDGAEEWARTTLDEHKDDVREFVYSRDEWEECATHDPAWNAAQQEMMQTGKMHGYMRMYWAKKILEWSKSPQQALDITIYLNDKYSIDGGDPNGYVGILWSIAGVHDRPWTEREVFGKIRYMNYGGLKRKFDIEKYIETWTSHQTNLIT